MPSNLESGMLGTFSSLESCCNLSLNQILTTPLPLGPNELLAVAGNGFVKIEQIQPAGKRAMKAADFVAGYVRNAVLRLLIPDSTSLIV